MKLQAPSFNIFKKDLRIISKNLWEISVGHAMKDTITDVMISTEIFFLNLYCGSPLRTSKNLLES